VLILDESLAFDLFANNQREGLGQLL